MQGLLRAISMASLATLATACSSLGYVAHVAHGQAQLVLQRKPIDRVIADPHTAPSLAARLRIAQAARAFATSQLGLPDNRSYTTYVELHRPFVVWNVFAAPKYSIDPVLHCFPIAGCVPYRGYFDETRANDEAARLQSNGDDVYVGGVSAYSTLGWFSDPILSTMLRWDDDELIGTIFHELAHQLIYVQDDTAFNESFASFVQDEGLRQWWTAHNAPPHALAQRQVDDDFARLVLDLREHLRQIYADAVTGTRASATKIPTLDDARLDAAKAAAISDFRTRYAHWRDAHWPDDHRYDAFVAQPINNASVLPFGLYDQWLPAFAALFHASGNDWTTFYARVRELAHDSANVRAERLATLAATASSAVN